MATRKRTYPRPLYLVLILVALLLGAGAIARGAFAASSPGMAGSGASAPAPALAQPSTAKTQGAPASNSKPDQPYICGSASDYIVTQTVGAYNYSSGTLVSGSQCNDCVVNVPIPFTFYLYGIPHNSVNASSNGNLQFTTSNPAFNNVCLIAAGMGDTIFPQWDNLDTSTGTCGPSCGIYTSMTGPIGNRHFFMRWQAVLFATTQLVRFQVDLYEATGINNESTFQIIYGDFVGGNGIGATVGVQKGGGPQFTQYECNTGGTPPDRVLTFSQAPCTTATPTRTPTVTLLSITILKLNDVNNNPVPNWPMTLHQGPSCVGPVLQTGLTDGRGLLDFTGLSAGDYSVEEAMQNGWTPVTGACQNVTASMLAHAGASRVTSVSKPGANPAYPGAGDDTFLSGGDVSLYLNAPPGTPVLATPVLNGVSTMHRDDPCVGCAPANHPNVNRTTVDTQMTSINMTGNDAVFGPLHIRESPSRPSLGQIRQQSGGVDFPADSFFDIFIEVELPDGTVLHNEQPVHITAVIDSLPQGLTLYQSADNLNIPLLNSSGQVAGSVRNIHFVVLLPREIIIIFRNHPHFSITVIKINYGTNQPIPDWTMKLHTGPNCTSPVVQTGLTNADGLYDFTDLTPGDYSVEEVLQPGWTPVSGVCQAVTISPSQAQSGDTAAKVKSSAKLGSNPAYPGAGVDVFPSGGGVTVSINGAGSDNVTLNGPTTVQRSDPCVGCGPGGRTTIETEMTAMDLTGQSSVFGPLHLRESPSRPSLGQIRQQQPGVDFPANSFFDVFAEFDMSIGTLHTNDPVHVQSVINAIPPALSVYLPPTNPDIPLYNSAEQVVGSMRNVIYVPLPRYEIFIIFRNLPATPTPTNTRTSTPTATPTCVSGAPTTVPVSIVDFAFNPPSVTIPVGSTVVWTDNGRDHTTTSNTLIWDSGVLVTGQMYQVTFNTPGTYPYHCNIHSFMTGVIIVGAPCATNTPTSTFAATNTPTNTPTNTRTNTPTNTRPPTFTPTPTPCVGSDGTPCTSTPTPTIGCPAGQQCTPTPTATPTTCTVTPCQPTDTPTPSCGAVGCTSTPTPTIGCPAGQQCTPTPTVTPTRCVGSDGTPCTATPTPTVGCPAGQQCTPTNTATNTPTNTRPPTFTPTATPCVGSDGTPCTSTPTPTVGCPPGQQCTPTPTPTCHPGTPGCGTPTDTPTPCPPAICPPTATPTQCTVVPCQPTDTPTPSCGAAGCTSTPTPTCTPRMIMHLTWQGITQPSGANVQPVSITLKMGSLEVNYPLGNTDANGNRVISLNGLPPGTPYVWRAKGPRSLANSGTGTTPLAGVCTVNLEIGTMRAGDANNDNVVNVSDFTILRATNGKGCGQTGYDGRADFNNDCVVNITDFNLLRSNYGQSGAPAIRPFVRR